MTSHTRSARSERWLQIAIAGIRFTHILDFMIMMLRGPEFMRLFAMSDARFGPRLSA